MFYFFELDVNIMTTHHGMGYIANNIASGFIHFQFE